MPPGLSWPFSQQQQSLEKNTWSKLSSLLQDFAKGSPVHKLQGSLSIPNTQRQLSIWTAVAERSGDTALERLLTSNSTPIPSEVPGFLIED